MTNLEFYRFKILFAVSFFFGSVRLVNGQVTATAIPTTDTSSEFIQESTDVATSVPITNNHTYGTQNPPINGSATQQPNENDYVTLRIFWISTGILITIVAFLLAATIYLLVVHFRTKPTKSKRPDRSDAGYVIPNKYSNDPTMKRSVPEGNDNITQAESYAVTPQSVDNVRYPDGQTSIHEIDDRDGQQHRSTIPAHAGISNYTHHSYSGRHRETSPASSSTSSGQVPGKYETPIRFQMEQGVRGQYSPTATAGAIPTHPSASTAGSGTRPPASRRHAKPAVLPKPVRNPDKIVRQDAIAPELKPKLPERRLSEARSEDGYDNDPSAAASTPAPPLPGPNLPNRNKSKVEYDDPQELYENDAYYDDVEA